MILFLKQAITQTHLDSYNNQHDLFDDVFNYFFPEPIGKIMPFLTM